MDLKPNFVFFHQKKQNEKISHENEAKNRCPKRAPIVRRAKRGANYAEFGSRESFLIFIWENLVKEKKKSMV